MATAQNIPAILASLAMMFSSSVLMPCQCLAKLVNANCSCKVDQAFRCCCGKGSQSTARCCAHAPANSKERPCCCSRANSPIAVTEADPVRAEWLRHLPLVGVTVLPELSKTLSPRFPEDEQVPPDIGHNERQAMLCSWLI